MKKKLSQIKKQKFVCHKILNPSLVQIRSAPAPTPVRQKVHFDLK